MIEPLYDPYRMRPVNRHTMRESVASQWTPQPQKRTRRNVTKLSRAPRAALFMMLIGVCLIMTPVYAIVVALPVSLLAFTSTALFVISIVMCFVINDRHKEIHALSKGLDEMGSKLAAANRARDTGYWDDVNTISRRRNESERHRKQRQASDLYALGDPHSRASAERILSQLRAAEKAGLCDVPELRIGTAERERVICALGDHYAAGRLERDELDTRMDQAAKAKTAIQLAELLRDMP